MIILGVDTVDFNSAIGIIKDGKTTVRTYISKKDDLLKKISDFLALNNIELKNIDGFIVYLGPGKSFTGTRVGISIINALSYALDKPTFGYCHISEKDVEKRLTSLLERSKDIKKFVKHILVPVYSREPNITQGKSRMAQISANDANKNVRLKR